MFLLLLLFFAAYPQQPASIQGVVVKQGTGEPIAGATVQLNLTPENGTGREMDIRIPPEDFHRTATSDQTGRFILENVTPGEYQLIATHPSGGYVPGEYGQRTP